MDLREVTARDKNQYNKLVTHVIQSWEWGEFRKKMGVKILRYGIFKKNKMVTAFCLTLHPIPLTKKYIGYLPKGPAPNKELALSLEQIGHDYSCAFIKLEPNIEKGTEPYSIYPTFLPSPKPLFTKHNFIIDLGQTEEQLLKKMNSKTRYNIRLAQKKGVKVEERVDEKAFKIHLKLYFETTQRQGYFGHNSEYHHQIWQTLRKNNMARVLIAFFKKKPLASWMLVNFKDTLYYPYGGSSLEYKEVMASNLVAWHSILLGQRLGFKKFDLWGALSPNPNPKDPWFGFHRFKAGYGGRLVEYVGTYDLVFDQTLYFLLTAIDRSIRLKVLLLKLLGR